MNLPDAIDAAAKRARARLTRSIDECRGALNVLDALLATTDDRNARMELRRVRERVRTLRASYEQTRHALEVDFVEAP